MKNIKKCFNYTLFLCVFLAAGCASAITQIPKSDRMNSGLNISAALMENGSPWEPNENAIDVIRVNLTNDGNSKVSAKVVCSRNGYDKTATVIVLPYTIREVYFGFQRDEFHPDINCRLENVDFLEWYPLM